MSRGARPSGLHRRSPRRASAADLKFLHHRPRVRARNFRSKSGTRIIKLLVPFIFSKFVSEVAALYHELRKEGTSGRFFAHGPPVRAERSGA